MRTTRQSLEIKLAGGIDLRGKQLETELGYTNVTPAILRRIADKDGDGLLRTPQELEAVLDALETIGSQRADAVARALVNAAMPMAGVRPAFARFAFVEGKTSLGLPAGTVDVTARVDVPVDVTGHLQHIGAEVMRGFNTSASRVGPSIDATMPAHYTSKIALDFRVTGTDGQLTIAASRRAATEERDALGVPGQALMSQPLEGKVARDGRFVIEPLPINTGLFEPKTSVKIAGIDVTSGGRMIVTDTMELNMRVTGRIQDGVVTVESYAYRDEGSLTWHRLYGWTQPTLVDEAMIQPASARFVENGKASLFDMVEDAPVPLGTLQPSPIEMLTALKAGDLGVIAHVADTALLAALEHPGFTVLSSKQPKPPEVALAMVRMFARITELPLTMANANLVRSLCAQVGCVVEEGDRVGSIDVNASLHALGNVLPAGDASLRALLRLSRSMGLDPFTLHVHGENLGHVMLASKHAVITERQEAAPAARTVTLSMLPSMAKPLAVVQTMDFGSPWDTHIGRNTLLDALGHSGSGGAYTATDRQLMTAQHRRTDGRPPSTIVEQVPQTAGRLHTGFSNADREPRYVEFFARVAELASPGSQPHEVLRQVLKLQPLPAKAITDESVLSLLRIAKAVGVEPADIRIDGGLAGISTLPSSPAFPWYLVED